MGLRLFSNIWIEDKYYGPWYKMDFIYLGATIVIFILLMSFLSTFSLVINNWNAEMGYMDESGETVNLSWFNKTLVIMIIFIFLLFISLLILLARIYLQFRQMQMKNFVSDDDVIVEAIDKLLTDTDFYFKRINKKKYISIFPFKYKEIFYVIDHNTIIKVRKQKEHGTTVMVGPDNRRNRTTVRKFMNLLDHALTPDVSKPLIVNDNHRISELIQSSFLKKGSWINILGREIIIGIIILTAFSIFILGTWATPRYNSQVKLLLIIYSLILTILVSYSIFNRISQRWKMRIKTLFYGKDLIINTIDKALTEGKIPYSRLNSNKPVKHFPLKYMEIFNLEHYGIKIKLQQFHKGFYQLEVGPDNFETRKYVNEVILLLDYAFLPRVFKM